MEGEMRKGIIIGLVFFTLALVSGCDKSEKKECEDKGDHYFWDGSDKKCKKKTGTEGTSTGGASTVGTPTGEDTTPGAITPEACKLKKGYNWDLDSSQCKEMEYMILMVPEYITPGDKVLLGYSLYDYEDINDYQNQLGVLWQLTSRVCKRIHKFDLFRIRVVVRKPVDRTKSWSVTEDINVCIGESKRGTDTDVRCSVGVYEIDTDGAKLKELSSYKESECLSVFDPSSG